MKFSARDADSPYRIGIDIGNGTFVNIMCKITIPPNFFIGMNDDVFLFQT
jgi:hypothetical protein